MGLDAAYRKLTGAGGRLFADPQPAPDEVSFQIDNTSAAYYDSVYYKLHKKDLQPVPAPRTSPQRIDLADVLQADFLAAITAAQKIGFHAVGDTGAAKVNSFQTAGQAIENEASVANAMVQLEEALARITNWTKQNLEPSRQFVLARISQCLLSIQPLAM